MQLNLYIILYDSKLFNCKKENIHNCRTAGLVTSIIFFRFRISANDLKIALKSSLILNMNSF